MLVAIYIRVSTDEQAQDGYSLAAQERICRAFVESRGWQVYAIYADEGISGRSAKRPALQRMLADMRAGRIKGVIVHKLDRLARNLRLTLEIIDELKQRNVAFASVNEQIDFTTPMGWAMFQVQGVFAEFYSRNLSVETIKGLREKAQQGLWVGPVPYGYVRSDATLALSDDAPIVAQIFKLYVSGVESYTSICDSLNAAGHRTLDWKTKTRGLFGREGVRTILRNRAYCGYVSSSGEEYQGIHPAIVSEAIWERAQEIRDIRTSKGGFYSATMPKVGGLLTEIVYCSDCGDRMWVHQSGRATSRAGYYRCSGNSRRTCESCLQRTETVDSQALDLLRALSLPADWRTTILRKAEALIKPIAEKPKVNPATIRRQIEEFTLSHIEGDISTEFFHEQRTRLRARLAEAQQAQQGSERLNLQKAAEVLENMNTLVDRMSAEQQRSMLRLVFTHVWITQKRVVAITPTTLYAPLVVAVCEREVLRGCPTGIILPFDTSKASICRVVTPQRAPYNLWNPSG